jgi:3',5'-cyclic AMP phosphodiesterase CpdA
MRFLAGRGFGAETIVRVLRHDEQAQDRTDADDTDATAGSRATVSALRRSGVG